MRRSRIVPSSPTGFPREQDLMFPFPQEKESSKDSKLTPVKDVQRPSKDDHAIRTPPPSPMMNGHNGGNEHVFTNGRNDDQDEIPETTSPPLPLPPTPEPSSHLLPSSVNGVKSPPPPSPPIPGEQNAQRQSTESNSETNSIKEAKEDKEQQKVRYYIIPSPAPSSPKQEKENSPPQTKGSEKNIEMFYR